MEICPLELRESCALVCFAFCFVQWCITFALYGSTSRYWLVSHISRWNGRGTGEQKKGKFLWKGSGRCESRHWIEFLYRWSKFGNSITYLNRLRGRLKAMLKKSVQNIKHFWCLLNRSGQMCVMVSLNVSVAPEQQSRGNLWAVVSVYGAFCLSLVALAASLFVRAATREAG